MIFEEWNEELAAIAQTWTNQCDCVFQQNEVYPCFHEPTGGQDRSPVAGRGAGQNIAWGTLRSTRADWSGRAQGWYDEVYDFNSTQVDSFIGRYRSYHPLLPFYSLASAWGV